MHHGHYKKYANIEEAKWNKPDVVANQEQWESLCDHFNSEKFKKQSEANTKVDLKNALEPCLDHLQIHMEVNVEKPGVKQCLVDMIKCYARQLRYRYHLEYTKYATLEDAKRNKPNSISSQENWEAFCDYFNSNDFKKQSAANASNRAKVRVGHVTGRTPFTVIKKELTEMHGFNCDVLELYRSTHEKEDGVWSSEDAKDKWETMMQKKETYAEQGNQQIRARNNDMSSWPFEQLH